MIEFFMVWNESGHAPTYKHPTLESAKQEAERLTRRHGGEFHVLKSLASVKRNDVTWTDHEIDDVPF